MSERRIALVIGNSAYQNSSPLKNPVNDAALITRALLRRGFEVVGGASTEVHQTGLSGGQDLNSLALSLTFAQFKAVVQRLRDEDQSARLIVVIYYAGHGVQVGDKNYLVPVDDTLDAGLHNLGLLDIKGEMETLIGLVGEEGSVVLFLDACRNGPLSDQQKRNLMGLLEQQEREERQAGTLPGNAQEDGRNLSIGATRGRLSTFKMPHGAGCGRTFIGFATAPGDLAQDGLGDNSAFAIALAKHLEVRGLHIEDLFDRVARDVLAVIRKDYDGTIQDPWSETNVNQTLYLHARDPRPVWVLGLGGLAAGLFICLAVFKQGKLIETVLPLVWLLGLGFGLVLALGSLHWGSGRKARDLFLAMAGPGIGFALALAILKVLPEFRSDFTNVELTGDRAIASSVYKAVVLLGGALYLVGTWLVRGEKNESPPRTWLGRLNRILTWGLPFVIVGVLWRLETYLTGATPEQTAFAMFAVLGGVIYAGSIPLALRAQGGLFSQFGPFTGSMTIGLLMAAFFGFYEMGKWTLGIAPDNTAASQALLVALGTLWHGLLGAQVGYCFAYYVPDHRVPR